MWASYWIIYFWSSNGGPFHSLIDFGIILCCPRSIHWCVKPIQGLHGFQPVSHNLRMTTGHCQASWCGDEDNHSAARTALYDWLCNLMSNGILYNCVHGTVWCTNLSFLMTSWNTIIITMHTASFFFMQHSVRSQCVVRSRDFAEYYINVELSFHSLRLSGYILIISFWLSEGNVSVYVF